MMTRLVLLAVILFGASAAATAEEVVVLAPNGSREGHWKTDQGYWVRTHYPGSLQKTDEADPGFLTVRLGLVHGGPLHPGPFAVGAKELEIISQMWLVIREGDAVTLRAKLEREIDLGNEIHYIALVNATAELVPKMEIEFEERRESRTRRFRVPVSAFINAP